MRYALSLALVGTIGCVSQSQHWIDGPISLGERTLLAVGAPLHVANVYNMLCLAVPERWRVDPDSQSLINTCEQAAQIRLAARVRGVSGEWHRLDKLAAFSTQTDDYACLVAVAEIARGTDLVEVEVSSTEPWSSAAAFWLSTREF